MNLTVQGNATNAVAHPKTDDAHMAALHDAVDVLDVPLLTFSAVSSYDDTTALPMPTSCRVYVLASNESAALADALRTYAAAGWSFEGSRIYQIYDFYDVPLLSKDSTVRVTLMPPSSPTLTGYDPTRLQVCARPAS